MSFILLTLSCGCQKHVYKDGRKADLALCAEHMYERIERDRQANDSHFEAS